MEFAEDFIEGVPPIAGTYTGSDGKAHLVRGTIRTWQYPLDASWGPDYHINFTIDFYDTASLADDQLFSGYLFTNGRNVIAGKTWWNSIPFGFYAVKGGTILNADSSELLTKEEQAVVDTILADNDTEVDSAVAGMGEPDFVGIILCIMTVRRDSCISGRLSSQPIPTILT